MSLCATLLTQSLMCDITNKSDCVLLQLAHRKTAEWRVDERISLMKSFLGCYAQCNLSDEHYAFMLSFMPSQEGDS